MGTGSVYLQQSRSAESETSGISCYSLSSSTRSPPLEELSNFAEQLSCDIISDCFSAMFSGTKTTCGITRKIQRKNHVSSYADRIAALKFHFQQNGFVGGILNLYPPCFLKKAFPMIYF
jgi:regulator of PEP synthase PpsR (kinase-PPPase family)